MITSANDAAIDASMITSANDAAIDASMITSANDAAIDAFEMNRCRIAHQKVGPKRIISHQRHCNRQRCSSEIHSYYLSYVYELIKLMK